MRERPVGDNSIFLWVRMNFNTICNGFRYRKYYENNIMDKYR